MLNKHYTNKILFLNIDTVSQYAKFEDMDESKQKLFLKRFHGDSRQMWNEVPYVNGEAGLRELNGQLYSEKAALHSEWGKIACITFLVMDENYKYQIMSLTNIDEKVLLQTFLNNATSVRDWPFKREEMHKSKAICSYAGFSFTWPYIAHRCLVNGMPIPAPFDYSEGKPWEQEHLISLSNIWNYNRSGSYTSLDTLASIFGVDYQEGVDLVGRWYYDNAFETLKEHSISRTLTLATCYLRVKGIQNNLIKTK